MKHYSISDEGWLQGEDIEIKRSPDFGGLIVPTYIIMHYSASGRASGTINWLTRRDSIYVSGHIVIARDGKITQLVPFTLKAFHAGRSTWDGLTNLNAYSVGIELVNWGKLQLATSSSDIVSYTEEVIPERNRIFQRHQSGKGNPCWWETYTPSQIDSAIDVCAVLTKHYDIREVVGHDDISPGRKIDPGPALDMDNLRIAIQNIIDNNLASPESDTRRISATVEELKTEYAKMLEQFVVNNEENKA